MGHVLEKTGQKGFFERKYVANYRNFSSGQGNFVKTTSAVGKGTDLH